jgi:hypothetical protein
MSVEFLRFCIISQESKGSEKPFRLHASLVAGVRMVRCAGTWVEPPPRDCYGAGPLGAANAHAWNEGYWGQKVGFYGGVN